MAIRARRIFPAFGSGRSRARLERHDQVAKCLPFGIPAGLDEKIYPEEVIQTPGEVMILVWENFPIIVWTDGRGHPKDLAPSYNGHSIGHWVGDTLFVDTVGVNEVTALDVERNPHSGAMHIQWSIQRVSKDVNHVHITLYDDGAFTEPVTTTNIWHRVSGPKWQELDDESCWENNQVVGSGISPPGFVKY